MAQSPCAGYLSTRIEASPTTYPWKERYRIYPGPNSNTYVQWILGSQYTLGWRGIGRRYSHRIRVSPAQ
ncbi:MAG: DUF3750 domain-containing protein [Rhodopirellula bahusiensis]|uniref:DUF3750 domain-containing protein n=1 Tax=Rhodopirellula bahusiensis TaxID=2014065 RepID=UPI003267DA85